MICSARNSSRRCTIVTFDAMFDRYSASSTAVLPPPITATGWFLKKKPSQVAHADTPRPLKASSVGKPRYFAEAPGRDDQRVARVFRLAAEQTKRPRAELHAVDVVVDQVGAETLRVAFHSLHELGALHAQVVAGPIVDVGGRGHLPADFDARDQRGLERGARRINGRRVTGRTRADDDEPMML